LESIAETQPQRHPALLRLSKMISPVLHLITSLISTEWQCHPG
jgi:hypothetical protein